LKTTLFIFTFVLVRTFIHKTFQAKQRYLEAVIWISALILLAFTPVQGEHYSLCVFNNLGIGFCPGCGLGHSITYFFNGDLSASFNAHPLGIPAVAILIFRILSILKQNKKYQPI
jgi:hypothetical protein